MRKGIQLFEYQLDMIRRIDEAFSAHQSVMVQMPTGTGKTMLLAEQVKSEERRVKNPDGVKIPDGVKREKGKGKEEKSEKGKVKNPCVWIVAHRRELVEQIKETLEASLNVKCEMLNATHNVKCEMLNVKRGKPLDSSLFTFHSSLIKVFSIQWLSKHYHELEERPSLIIIDEAHHAVAKTYKEVMDAYPEARKLGLTATPCRLNKHGFTDLFDVLLQSWSYNKFIADGWLSLYDYMSIKEDSEDWRLVNSLKKRGADGDFSLKEMSEKLNVQPSIERLCDTILRYAPDKKGITYAIDIAHAERIAQYYREHGLNAVAISSKTPLEERKAIIERFKGTNDSIKDTNCHELSMNLANNNSLKNTNCQKFKNSKSALPTIQNSKFKTQNSYNR